MPLLKLTKTGRKVAFLVKFESFNNEIWFKTEFYGKNTDFLLNLLRLLLRPKTSYSEHHATDLGAKKSVDRLC